MGEPVLCYNRGCGKTFVPPADPEQAKEDCLYHPGAPYFHDAYKEWTCCRKKSTDFTQFLNFPGCTKGRHSRVKPQEPEFVTGNLEKVDDDGDGENKQKEQTPPKQEEVRAPIAARMPRPSLDAPLVRVKHTVAKSLEAALEKTPLVARERIKDDEVAKGEQCKNGGCKQTYTGDLKADNSACMHHPGVAIFHEGMKFWTCCQRKTSDWESFQKQEGCSTGTHKWRGDQEDKIKCRYDWHQTAPKVTLAIYGKRYDPSLSHIDVSPVRLQAHVVFPEQGGSFDLDLELNGVILTEETTATMFGTKLEVVLRKAEAGSWSAIGKEIVAESEDDAGENGEKQEEEEQVAVDVLDLDDLELSSAGGRAVLSPEASGGRTASLLSGQADS